ncbi:hypothetical protein [Paenibacillus arenilitoris]|uniref:Uncharacterized protein n=1 Tax=Paenibacillus arenilitoris TaxID=2772299 RepID=A0A927CMA7_9BACL|nr:hypothetical protein [Paenibacillus arenilitoris]MBD2869198.1 hypothetical protein [Paenibacillus arenilitoris]
MKQPTKSTAVSRKTRFSPSRSLKAGQDKMLAELEQLRARMTTMEKLMMKEVE